MLSKIKGYCIGISYAFLWYGSILLGFYFLYAPLLPLIFVNRKLFRRITDCLLSSWESFNTTLLHVFGVSLVLTGDSLLDGENALMILNHPTRTDWNFFWAGLHHSGPNHNAKLILKDGVRRIPGIGWILAMARNIYIKRNWAEDVKIIDDMLDFYKAIKEEESKQIILFPEGTNINAKTLSRSKEYARKTNKPQYKHVLHPRTTGFVHIAKGLLDREMLDAVYDVTIAYPDTRPDTEADIIRGGLPHQVNIHMVRHPVSRLPSTYVGLEKWLEERWRDKEAALDQFYCSPSEFSWPVLSLQHKLPRRLTQLQPVCLLFCSGLFLRLLLLVLTNVMALAWIFLITIFILIIETKLGGVQELEVNLEMKRAKVSEEGVREEGHLKDE